MWRLPKPASYRVLNEITVSTSALNHNIRYFAKLNPQAEIVPILKSNAYGHGLIPTAKFIDQQLKVPFIGVDSLFEAYELTKTHTRTPILILGYTFPENYHVFKQLPFSFSVFDPQTVLALNRFQPGAKIHIKLDTGMCRLGIMPADVGNFITTLKECNRLQVEGIYSHLSSADTSKRFTQKQISLFKQMVAQFEAAGFRFRYKHIAATAGASWITDPYFNLIRLGLGFYGYYQKNPKVVTPALTLISHLAQVKTVPANSHIGYDGTSVTTKPTPIGIIPMGYADGIHRSLSNHGYFTMSRHRACPIRGRVSMNMTTIELPSSRVQAGESITVIDPHTDAVNSLYRHAQIAGTIPYTLLTGLNPTIRRTFI